MNQSPTHSALLPLQAPTPRTPTAFFCKFNSTMNAYVVCEERRGFTTIFDSRGPVVCPKPRRVGVLANNPVRPMRWHMSHQGDICDSKAGAELLDIILGSRPLQEVYGEENFTTPIASSPPPFGSPPVRVSNPVIQDSLFGDGSKLTSISTLLSPSPSSPSSSTQKGGCVRAKLGLNPAAVRVEGFDCLNRDRQSSSIPTVA